MSKGKTYKDFEGLSSIRGKLKPGEVNMPEKAMIAEGNHNPNPFDFIPFIEGGPALYTISELDSSGDLYSGYIEVTLKTLTPLHIVGKQDPAGGNSEGKKILRSHFYREVGESCIPGSSIRGMLRSFIEALTNGWVSQVQEKPYEKLSGVTNQKGRHIGFNSFDEYENIHRGASLDSTSNHINTMQSAIDPAFKPKIVIDNSKKKIDIASYLFGYVIGSEEEGIDSKALRGKVMIEDAYVSNNDLKDNYEIPDIETEAFMGGPHPSASNWWYLKPKEIWKRNPGRCPFPVAEFVGEGYWGRKFYYHQDPVRCVKWYNDNWIILHRKERRGEIIDIPYYTYNIEAMDKECTFRIDIRRLPEKLLFLFCLSLCPSDNIRHKLGYGKTYGYGSVEFTIAKAMLRKEEEVDWPDPLEDLTEKVTNYLAQQWGHPNIEKFIDDSSLRYLAKILGWPPIDDITFTYPPFNDGNFQTPVRFDNFTTAKSSVTLSNPSISGKAFITSVTENEGSNIAFELWDRKKTIHFRLYQESAKGYEKIKNRVP